MNVNLVVKAFVNGVELQCSLDPNSIVIINGNVIIEDDITFKKEV